MADENENFGLQPGDMIDQYRIERELGRGTYGVVYLAHHMVMDRDVAFKVLLPEWVNTPGYIDSFFREAKMAAQLDHQNIVQAIEAGTTAEGIYYFVMEYVPGKSIEDIRTMSPERLSIQFLLHLAVQLADAMDYAWTRHHLTHGDIKPSNLLIREQDKVLKLADLGLASIGSQINQDEIMATPMYAAPEVISAQHDKIGVASDIYSFGVMFYELAAGSAPFHGEIEELLQCHLYTQPQPLIEANPDIAPEISDFTARMLAKVPEDRPESWAEIASFMRSMEQKLFQRPQPGRSAQVINVNISNTAARIPAVRREKKVDWMRWVVFGIAFLVIASAIGVAVWGSMPA